MTAPRPTKAEIASVAEFVRSHAAGCRMMNCDRPMKILADKRADRFDRVAAYLEGLGDE